MNGTATTARITANHAVTKRLGHWTTARTMQVRARRGVAVLDLRSPHIPDGELLIDAELDHAVLTLLVTDDTAIDDWDLRWTGRGRIKDHAAPNLPGGRRVVLHGHIHDAEIRVRRGGLAVLTAMFSREFLTGLRQARAEGRTPAVADPTYSG